MNPTPRFIPALLLSSIAAFAQVAPAPSTAASATEKAGEKNADGTLVLSPFEVSASNDVGYIATNSLAGSRLNSALKDTPAIIDVFTKEFLADLGANDLSTAMAYANNSQEDVGDTLRVINGGDTLSAGAAFQFRSRGLPGSRARNYFDTRLPIDLFVVERLDESRGPNSVLFGIGPAGGIVNSTTKRALLGNQAVETNLQAGTYGHFYAALDVNQPLIRQKLGVRFNARHSEEGSWRDYIATRKQGIQGAVTYRPFKNTEIRGEYERGHLHGTLSRTYPARDGVTRWWDAGSPTNASVGTAALTAAETASGLTRPTTATRLYYIANQGFVVDGRNALTTTGRANGSALLDPARMPLNANPNGPGGRTSNHYDLYSAIVEQRILSNLFGEVAFYHERGDWLNYDGGVNDNNFVQGDPNLYLRNANTIQSFGTYRPATDASGNTVNPNAGQSFIDATWRRRYSDYEHNALRASLAYELDLGRVGAHRLALMLQRQQTDSGGRTEREVWLGAPFAADPAGDVNAVWRRNYATLGQSNTFFSPDPLSPATITTNYPGRATPLTSGWIPNGSFNATEQTVDSGLLALQSYWLKRRVVTTFGYRLDEVTQDRTSATADRSGIWAGSNGIFVLNPATKTRFEFSGRTKTAGLVVHPTSWLSLFVNGAENLGLPAAGQRVGPDGAVPPPPHAKGIDGGITIESFKGKIVTRLSYYKTVADNQVNAMGVNNAFTPRYNTVIGILDDPNGDRNFADRIYTPAQMAKYSELRPQAIAIGDTLDTESSGYEARVTANLSAGLRFILNYSYTNQDKVNTYPRTKLLWDQVYAFVKDLEAANPNVNVNALAGSSGSTLGALLATNVTDLADRSFDFEQSLGNRKHKTNIFGNYTLQGTRLKGLALGGGGRYQSAINAGSNNLNQILKGSDLLLFDAMARYPLRFSLFDRRIRGSLQVNVRNLLDERDPQILRYTGNGLTIDRVNLQTPREVIFSFTTKL